MSNCELIYTNISTMNSCIDIVKNSPNKKIAIKNLQKYRDETLKKIKEFFKEFGY